MKIKLEGKISSQTSVSNLVEICQVVTRKRWEWQTWPVPVAFTYDFCKERLKMHTHTLCAETKFAKLI